MDIAFFQLRYNIISDNDFSSEHDWALAYGYGMFSLLFPRKLLLSFHVSSLRDLQRSVSRKVEFFIIQNSSQDVPPSPEVENLSDVKKTHPRQTSSFPQKKTFYAMHL
jgi:hypothetical protein